MMESRIRKGDDECGKGLERGEMVRRREEGKKGKKGQKKEGCEREK
jgi:hypothetical protein